MKIQRWYHTFDISIQAVRRTTPTSKYFATFVSVQKDTEIVLCTHLNINPSSMSASKLCPSSDASHFPTTSYGSPCGMSVEKGFWWMEVGLLLLPYIFCLQLLSLSFKLKVQVLSVWQVRKEFTGLILAMFHAGSVHWTKFILWCKRPITKLTITITVMNLQATNGVCHLGSTMGLSRFSNSLIGTSYLRRCRSAGGCDFLRSESEIQLLSDNLFTLDEAISVRLNYTTYACHCPHGEFTGRRPSRPDWINRLFNFLGL